MQGRELIGAALFVAVLATPGVAQEPAPAAAPVAPPTEVTLKFDREVFEYPGAGRRDPFTPLVGSEGAGPRFEDLSLRGIIYSNTPGRSVALVVDATGKIYRVRAGERVGNARVLDVGPRRVVFSVESFGRARQEILELKRRGAEGAAQ